jgi:hypothetical protein
VGEIIMIEENEVIGNIAEDSLQTFSGLEGQSFSCVLKELTPKTLYKVRMTKENGEILESENFGILPEKEK